MESRFPVKPAPMRASMDIVYINDLKVDTVIGIFD